MKITKKITSIVLALLLAVSAFAGLAITANAAPAYSYDKPASATLKIHKGDIDQVGDGTTQVGDNATNKVIGNTNTLTGTELDEPADFKALTKVQAQFAIYYVGNEKTPVPTNVDKTQYTPKGTVKTDKTTGIATFTADGTDNPLGLYYVEEVNFPDMVTYQTTAPFFVYLPMTGQNVKDTSTTSASYTGMTWLATVDVYPKNLTTLGGATLTKTINNKNVADITADDKVTQYPEFTIYDITTTQPTEGEGNVLDYTGVPVVAGNIVIGTAYATYTVNADDRYATATVAQKNGTIAVDGLPVGRYRFVETKPAIVDGKTLPIATYQDFTISIGQNVDVVTADISDSATADGAVAFGTVTKTADDNATYSFTVNNSTEPTVTKEVTKADGAKTNGDGGSFNIGDNVVWTITPDVPTDIANYQKFEITDNVDSRLDFVYADGGAAADAVVVKLDGTEVTTGFTKTVTGRAIKVEITDFAALIGKTLTIEITTKINSSADADAQINNKATLDYTNEYGHTGSDDSLEPYVYTGAFKIEKVDAADSTKMLANVEFTLTDSTGAAVNVTYDNAKKIYVVDKTSNSNTVKTEADGTIYVKGLKYATGTNAYKLTETKTNNGYQLLSAPVDITVAYGTGTNAVTVKNVKQPDLPLTGGMGTILFTVAGLALIGGGAFFFIRSRKTRKEEI